MESNQRTAPNFLHKGQGKDTHFQTQIKWVFVAFYGQPKTISIVEVETGIILFALSLAIVEPSNTIKL